MAPLFVRHLQLVLEEAATFRGPQHKFGSDWTPSVDQMTLKKLLDFRMYSSDNVRLQFPGHSVGDADSIMDSSSCWPDEWNVYFMFALFVPMVLLLWRTILPLCLPKHRKYSVAVTSHWGSTAHTASHWSNRAVHRGLFNCNCVFILLIFYGHISSAPDEDNLLFFIYINVAYQCSLHNRNQMVSGWVSILVVLFIEQHLLKNYYY